jgi:sterol desaturase/sphingolipid hydroxylase (fatty acid hydroxylase superfamily)
VQRVDLTVGAIPIYFGSMGAEYAYLRAHAAERGPTPADYERRDTITSLAMGVGSLVAPLVLPKVLRRFALPSRAGLAVLAAGAGAVAYTVADDRRRRRARPDRSQPATGSEANPSSESTGRPSRPAAVAAVAAVAGTGVVVAATWARAGRPARVWRRRALPDLGNGAAAVALATLGWDFIYYWNHRIQHESRYLWAIHVVHHSSERYNLSTALRQPVADAFGTFVPYGLLCLLGVQPELINTARGINLLYQFWIHTDVIRSLGPLEGVFNTPSHHRVHHGSNPQYIDRNHGSILIVWDKLFGTFEPESEPVVYGLTKNIETFDLVKVATHEYTDIARDVAGASNWRDRLSYVVRGPGWAYRRHAARAARADAA